MLVDGSRNLIGKIGGLLVIASISDGRVEITRKQDRKPYVDLVCNDAEILAGMLLEGARSARSYHSDSPYLWVSRDILRKVMHRMRDDEFPRDATESAIIKLIDA